MKIYVGFNQHCDSSYIMQSNFNYFSMHTITWIWKVLYEAIILLEKAWGK